MHVETQTFRWMGTGRLDGPCDFSAPPLTGDPVALLLCLPICSPVISMIFDRVRLDQACQAFQPVMPLSGDGAAQSFWNPSDVATVGRILEVRRWRCGAVSARRHVFESTGFRVHSCSGEVRPISLDLDLAEILASDESDTDPSFPEVPSRLLSSHSWKKVMADQRCFDGDILRL